MNTRFIKAFELKKNKKYLFIFDDKSGATMDIMRNLSNLLHEHEIDCIGLRLKDKDGLKIVEQKL